MSARATVELYASEPVDLGNGHDVEARQWFAPAAFAALLAVLDLADTLERGHPLAAALHNTVAASLRGAVHV